MLNHIHYTTGACQSGKTTYLKQKYKESRDFGLRVLYIDLMEVETRARSLEELKQLLELKCRGIIFSSVFIDNVDAIYSDEAKTNRSKQATSFFLDLALQDFQRRKEIPNIYVTRSF